MMQGAKRMGTEILACPNAATMALDLEEKRNADGKIWRGLGQWLSTRGPAARLDLCAFYLQIEGGGASRNIRSI